jgi:hypothetical protein
MSLGIFNRPIKMARPVAAAGLGADACVWKNTTPDPNITGVQNWLNKSLAAHSYNKIGVDGKLGPATCGAWLYMMDNFDDFYESQDPGGAWMDCCQGWTWPTKVGSSTPEKNTYLANMWAEATKAGLPIGTYSDKTLEVQKQLNTNLVSHDMSPIDADGKLGAATCGAARWVDKNTGQWFFDYNAICKSFTDPTSAKVAANTVKVPPPSTVVPVAPADSALVLNSGKGKTSTATMVTGGIVVAALAGGYYWAKKKGWF